MKNYQLHVLPPLLPALLLLNVLCLGYAKSIIEPCSSPDSCSSLLSYLLPWDSKLSEIASRFQVNVSDILASNSVFPMTPSLGNQILRAKSLIKVPISCPCADGIRRSISTTYTVQAADTFESMSDSYGGLVSPQQIQTVNGINATNQLENGEILVIPLPCTCFNNTNNGETAVYLSYVVQRDEKLSQIGSKFGITITELGAINELSHPTVDPGDILAIPISACSSANLNWYNESLIVPNGSYALTATNCIKCTCGPTDLKLQCLPSGVQVPCYNLKCKGSNLFIGEAYMNQTTTGCNVTACVYRGHRGGKILRSLTNASYFQCKENENCTASSSWPLSSLPNYDVPFIALSPSPSPFPASDATPRIRASGPTSYQKKENCRLLGLASFICLLLPELVLYLLF